MAKESSHLRDKPVWDPVPVFLAPMSGITDAPFREAVRAFGVGTLVSEMVASHAMIQVMRDTRKLRHVFDTDRPTTLQLAGYDPDVIAQGVEIACDRGARAIDLNFGCPARKVTGKAAGSALMQYPDLCKQIYAKVGRAAADFGVPWSIKMRLGWDWDCLNAAELAAAGQGEGASHISVHGRTRCQFYKGHANWAAAADVAQRLDIPLIINGDIHDGADAATAMDQAHAQGYMVGRATTGKPWLLAQIEAARTGRSWHLSVEAQAQAHASLLENMLVFYGTKLGLKSYRKHLAAWLEGLEDASVRRKLLTSDDPQDVFSYLKAAQSLAQAA